MEQRMKFYTLRRPTLQRDEYGQEIKTYKDIGNIKAFISVKNESEYTANNQFIEKFDYIGITNNKSILREDLVGDYEVVHVVETRRKNYLYLKELKG